MIDTPAALAAWLPRLAAQERVAIRVEPTGHVAVQAEIAGLAFAWAPGEAFYLPLVAPASAARLERDATLAALRTFFENPQQQKISRDLKHDMILLAAAGIESAGMAFDTMLASYLLDAGERNHTLAELAQRYLDHALVKPGQVTGTGSLEKRPDELPVAAVANLVGEETDAALRLAPILVDRLREDDLERLFDELEIPLIEVLAAMERTGVRVDAARLADLSGEYGRRVATLEAEIYALASREFNIASPKQLQQVLFTEQKLPALRRTKSGPSTDASVLEELAAQHPLPAKIIEYRQYAKLKNTYVDALPALVNPRTGRVHATFQQAVAATGRLSSSDPNLQNIPIRTRKGARFVRHFCRASRAGFCCRPITRRSNCGCWRIFRATKHCARPSTAATTFIHRSLRKFSA